MHAFETMGNAVLLLYENGSPLLVTDPWLVGTAYYGSWAQYRPLSALQRTICIEAPFVWFSHGHPDHFHPESVSLLSRKTTILLGDHYSTTIYDFLVSLGFEDIRICQDKTWIPLSPEVRLLCISNMNQDTILFLAVGDTLIVNQNDAPLMGEGPFIKKMVSKFKNSYLLALCSNNADMINFVDEHGSSIAGHPAARKRGAIMEISKRCQYLGVKNFCCFSSYHIYARSDSAWANPYHIDWRDMQQHWTCSTNLIEPFATIDLDSGLVSVEHENQAPDLSQVADNTGDDDWSERMTDDDWSDVGNYFGKFQTLRSKIDFIDFVVGGERRRVFGGASRKFLPETKLRGIVFYAPRNSLMQTVRGGYFDDLLIGNFMKTHLVNMGLYPDFSPRVTKYGDSAGVYSSNQLVRFFWHYFRRSPMAIVRFYANQYWQYYWIPKVKAVLRRLGLFQAMKKLYSQI